jgi:hypothetical protein
VLAARDGGQEVRLVDHQDGVVPVHDPDVERHRHFLRQVPVEPDGRARRVHRVRRDGAVQVVDAALGQHRVDPLRRDARQSLDQVVAQGRPRPVHGQPQAGGVEAVALGQRRPELASHLSRRA